MKHPFFSYFGAVKELPSSRSLVCLSGDKEVLIEKCRLIKECNDIKCSVVAGGCCIDIWGTGLSVTSYANGNACVSGKISSVSVERRKSRSGDET